MSDGSRRAYTADASPMVLREGVDGWWVAERGVSRWVPAPDAPKKRKTIRVLQPCGTPAAERRHRKNGEPICAPCRAATNEKSRQDYRKRLLP